MEVIRGSTPNSAEEQETPIAGQPRQNVNLLCLFLDWCSDCYTSVRNFACDACAVTIGSMVFAGYFVARLLAHQLCGAVEDVPQTTFRQDPYFDTFPCEQSVLHKLVWVLARFGRVHFHLAKRYNILEPLLVVVLDAAILAGLSLLPRFYAGRGRWVLLSAARCLPRLVAVWQSLSNGANAVVAACQDFMYRKQTMGGAIMMLWNNLAYTGLFAAPEAVQSGTAFFEWICIVVILSMYTMYTTGSMQPGHTPTETAAILVAQLLLGLWVPRVLAWNFHLLRNPSWRPFGPLGRLPHSPGEGEGQKEQPQQHQAQCGRQRSGSARDGLGELPQQQEQQQEQPSTSQEAAGSGQAAAAGGQQPRINWDAVREAGRRFTSPTQYRGHTGSAVVSIKVRHPDEAIRGLGPGMAEQAARVLKTQLQWRGSVVAVSGVYIAGCIQLLISARFLPHDASKPP